MEWQWNYITWMNEGRNKCHNSALYSCTGLGTFVNEMNFGMKHAPGAGLIALLADLQSSAPWSYINVIPTRDHSVQKQAVYIKKQTHDYYLNTNKNLNTIKREETLLSIMHFINLEAKGSNCVCQWLAVKPFCLSTDDLYLKVTHWK